MNNLLDSKIIVVTGGTGSFGSTVCNYLTSTNVREIRIFSRDEKKQDDMRNIIKDERVKFYLGDIRDYESIKNVCINADFLFHAAALKQVPSCEFYPLEAVKSNILGTENVLKAAIDKSIKRVVLLSTDKAVYPINAMGLSKAFMEKLMTAKSRFIDPEESLLCATRYGNVMASRGSVIPLFVKQAKSGMPLTVTDPRMTRFLMSLKDSIDLVLYAFAEAKQGDIFIQKASSSTVGDLAKAIIEIFNSKSSIQIIGTRHGEKLYESLLSREEMSKAEDLGNYFRVPSDNRDLNYAKYYTEGKSDLSKFESYTSHNTGRLSLTEVKNLLLNLDYIKNELKN